MAKQYESVRDNRPSRSKFNLSYEKKFTADFGKLYPILCDEMVPGDIFKIGAEAVIRSQPLLAPILHRVDIKAEYFFVPYRLLWNDWEEFITGGEDGYTPITAPELEPFQPIAGPLSASAVPDYFKAGNLYDFLYGVTYEGDVNALVFNQQTYPVDYPRRAYNLIWWEFYRDENLQKDVTWDNGQVFPANYSDKFKRDAFVGKLPNTGTTVGYNPGRETAECLNGKEGNHMILSRSWEKDFFTSALPFQQKGDTPALPIAGALDIFADINGNGVEDTGEAVGIAQTSALPSTSFGTVLNTGGTGWTGQSAGNMTRLKANMNQAVTFDVADLRLAFQTQRWLEQNARAGTRYTEFLRAHFGVSPYDSRLQRPEFIGSIRFPLIISEVLQTAPGQDGTMFSDPDNGAVGNMKGHGISVNNQFVGSYHAEEFGVIIGLVSFVPKPAYQQGLSKQWTRRTPLDYYFPEFAHLSERGIESQEIFWDPSAPVNENLEIFGFQGIYDEMRVKHSMVHGLFRDSVNTTGKAGFGFWHLGRYFDERPLLNESFIKIDQAADALMRSYPVQDEPPFFVNWGNSILGIRPMPFMAEPGLIDHV